MEPTWPCNLQKTQACSIMFLKTIHPNYKQAPISSLGGPNSMFAEAHWDLVHHPLLWGLKPRAHITIVEHLGCLGLGDRWGRRLRPIPQTDFSPWTGNPPIPVFGPTPWRTLLGCQGKIPPSMQRRRHPAQWMVDGVEVCRANNPELVEGQSWLRWKQNTVFQIVRLRRASLCGYIWSLYFGKRCTPVHSYGVTLVEDWMVFFGVDRLKQQSHAHGNRDDRSPGREACAGTLSEMDDTRSHGCFPSRCRRTTQESISVGSWFGPRSVHSCVKS